MNNEINTNRPVGSTIPAFLRQLINKKIVNDGEYIVKVAEDLRLPRSTVSSIVKVYQNSGRIETSIIRGKPEKK